MRIVSIIAGVLLAAAGLVWLLQGLGSQFVPQSFMTNSLAWVVIGATTFVAGVAVAVRSWRRQ